jgi:hypothetical protein
MEQRAGRSDVPVEHAPRLRLHPMRNRVESIKVARGAGRELGSESRSMWNRHRDCGCTTCSGRGEANKVPRGTRLGGVTVHVERPPRLGCTTCSGRGEANKIPRGTGLGGVSVLWNARRDCGCVGHTGAEWKRTRFHVAQGWEKSCSTWNACRICRGTAGQSADERRSTWNTRREWGFTTCRRRIDHGRRSTSKHG